jgi:hypothetical protein
MGSNDETKSRYPSQDYVIVKKPGGASFRENMAARHQDRVLKTVVHPAEQRRVQIIERCDGLFSYEEEELVMAYHPELAKELNDYRTYWVPTKPDVSIFESQEAAESAARGAVAWLMEI